MNFNDINYKGKPVVRNEFDGLGSLIDDGVDVSYYKHIYKSSFAGIISHDKTTGKHMCLQWNAWCWKQAIQRPDEALRFLLDRLK